MKLSELFKKCAWGTKYENIHKWVSYAFVKKGRTLYIYFEGSHEAEDWIANFDFLPTSFPQRPYKDMDITFRVHRGFLAAWKTVEDVVISKITEKVDGEYKWQHIIVVGYSHGGALAGLCHECVWFWRPDLRITGLEGYGFEAPRFYAAWSVKKELKERWSKFTVIRTNNDIVTHCPPAIFGFCHVGKILKIKGDTSLVKNKRIPKCVKSHYPEVVYQALVDFEKDQNE